MPANGWLVDKHVFHRGGETTNQNSVQIGSCFSICCIGSKSKNSFMMENADSLRGMNQDMGNRPILAHQIWAGEHPNKYEFGHLWAVNRQGRPLR